MPDSVEEPSIIIIGAGPSGLALAIELGHRDVPCLLLERNDRVGYAPRAKTTHTRTREHLRRWGIAEELAAASPFGVDYPSNVHFVTRLAGHHLVTFENALQCSPDRDERYSEHSQWIPQYKLESVLREHAQALPSVTIRFEHEFLSFQQDAHSVRVHVRDIRSGQEYAIEAEFLIGADGARSTIRDLIGARMVGTANLSRNYNVIFRAPGLAEAHDHGPGIMYWQLNPDVPSLIGPMDEGDLWFFMPTSLPAEKHLSPEEAGRLIAESTGIDLPYEVLSSDEWFASKLLADRYSDKRVFLIGDSCHLHPPFGGYGMNMGVSDAVDLGWKLAAVQQGWGSPALLQSYEIERRQVHEYVLEEAESNHALNPSALARDGIENESPSGERVRRQVSRMISEHKTSEFYALGVLLGYCYQNSPIIVDDEAGSEWIPSRDYVPSASPGCLAPHRWLANDESLYDVFGEGFTLLVLNHSANEDIGRATAEASRTNIPLKIVTIEDVPLAELYGTKLALIRPDQHIAWRGDGWPEFGLLDVVTGRASSSATGLNTLRHVESNTHVNSEQA